MKGYFIIDGKEYFGYDVIADHGSTSYATFLINKNNIACNRDFINGLNNGLFFDNVPVPDGAKVHVLPGCPIPNDDIRKNYRIKRDFDSGDFNVFPEFSSCNRLYVTRLCISDTLKHIVISDHYNVPLSNFNDDYVVKTGHMWIDFMSNNAWEMLLEKRCAKPCVSYKRLSIKSDNQLTPDALFLLYRLGTQPRSRENIEKFKLQLQAINQTNWREYPNSVRKVIIYASSYVNCSHHVCRHKTERNKVIEQFFNIESADYTDEDFNMLRDTIGLILDIDGTKYVSFSDLNYKLIEKGISTIDMEMFFGGIVQLKRREWKDA